MATKSTITIEKEFYEDNGIPMVKRIVKEDGVLIYENTEKVWEFETTEFPPHRFERWIFSRKNPARHRIRFYPHKEEDVKKYYELVKKAEDDETFHYGRDENMKHREYHEVPKNKKKY